MKTNQMKANHAYRHNGEWRFNEKGWPEIARQCLGGCITRCYDCGKAAVEYQSALTSAIESSVPFEDQGAVGKLVLEVNVIKWEKNGEYPEGLYSIPEIEVKFWSDELHSEITFEESPWILWAGGRTNYRPKDIVARIVDSSPDKIIISTKHGHPMAFDGKRNYPITFDTIPIRSAIEPELMKMVAGLTYDLPEGYFFKITEGLEETVAKVCKDSSPILTAVLKNIPKGKYDQHYKGSPKKPALIGEKCYCGKDAVAKIVEETWDKPTHGLSQYVCQEHFDKALRPYLAPKEESQEEIDAEVKRILELSLMDRNCEEGAELVTAIEETLYNLKKVFTITRKSNSH